MCDVMKTEEIFLSILKTFALDYTLIVHTLMILIPSYHNKSANIHQTADRTILNWDNIHPQSYLKVSNNQRAHVRRSRVRFLAGTEPFCVELHILPVLVFLPCLTKNM